MKQSPRNTVLGPLGRSDVPLASDTSKSVVRSVSIEKGCRCTCGLSFLFTLV